MSNAETSSGDQPMGALSRPLRGSASVAALIGLGAGGLAVFSTDNEVGSSALLLVGLFFAVTALLGRVPKIKIGDNEIDPSEVFAAGAQQGADHVADAVTQAALNSPDDPKKLAEVARNAEASLVRELGLRRIRLERFKTRDGESKVRLKAANGQIIGVIDDLPGLWD